MCSLGLRVLDVLVGLRGLWALRELRGLGGRQTGLHGLRRVRHSGAWGLEVTGVHRGA